MILKEIWELQQGHVPSFVIQNSNHSLHKYFLA